MIESRRLEDWDYDFIKSIFDVKAKEWTTLKYKKDFPASNTDRNKLEHVICAFSNTQGGHIFIGIEADSVNNVPIAMDGIDETSGLYERVTSFCGRITPRVTPKIRKISIPNSNKVFVAIYISESNEVHMASYGKCYVRINAQNLPADHYTVEKLFKKEYEFKERMKEILESRRRSLSPDLGWITVLVLPYGFRDGLIPIFDEKSGKLKRRTVDFLTKEQPILHAWDHKPTQFSFLQYSLDREGNIYAFVEVSHNGLIEIGETIDFSKEITPIRPQFVKEFVKEVLEYADKVYSFSGYDDTIRMVVDLTNMRDRELVWEGFHRGRPQYQTHELTIRRDFTLNDVSNNLDHLLDNIGAEFIRSFGVNILDK